MKTKLLLVAFLLCVLLVGWFVVLIAKAGEATVELAMGFFVAAVLGVVCLVQIFKKR